jgi:hypothetical protein
VPGISHWGDASYGMNGREPLDATREQSVMEFSGISCRVGIVADRIAHAPTKTAEPTDGR